MNPSPDNTAAIILAAGRSSRMGSPKALLALNGESFVDALIARYGAFCSPVVVVVGHHADQIEAGSRRRSDARFVTNERYDEGQFTSLQRGIEAVSAEASGFLFTLVDHPLVDPETLRRLLEPGLSVRVPTCGGRRGHPVYFSRSVAGEVLAAPSGSSTKEILRRDPARVQFIETHDPGILRDIDTPADYRQLAGGLA